jgi:hypothetical protein
MSEFYQVDYDREHSENDLYNYENEEYSSSSEESDYRDNDNFYQEYSDGVPRVSPNFYLDLLLKKFLLEIYRS